MKLDGFHRACAIEFESHSASMRLIVRAIDARIFLNDILRLLVLRVIATLSPGRQYCPGAWRWQERPALSSRPGPFIIFLEFPSCECALAFFFLLPR
jgi:hypothetical protein